MSELLKVLRIVNPAFLDWFGTCLVQSKINEGKNHLIIDNTGIDFLSLDPPDFEATFLPTNSTTIELSSITPRVGWDFFSVASTPSISQTVFNESASSLPLTFYDLAAGSQYKFNVSVSITNFCDLGSNTPSSTIVTVCTSMCLLWNNVWFAKIHDLIYGWKENSCFNGSLHL